MNKQQIKGAANEAMGEIKERVGRMTGDLSMEARGHAREMKGKMQKGLGDAKEALSDKSKDEVVVERTTVRPKDR